MSQIGAKKGKKQGEVQVAERVKLTVEQQIADLEKELAETKYNKATQLHFGLVKAKLARLREKQEHRAGAKISEGFAVRKSGDATVVLLGFPSTGKSTLLNALTKAHSRAGAYAFTTLTVIPGVLEYKDAKIQILDVPGIVEGAARGSGKGKEVLAVLRNADLVLLLLDVQQLNHYRVLQKEAFDTNLRLDQRPADVKIVKTARGGVRIGATVPLTKTNTPTIAKILAEYRVTNANIVIREDIDVDQFIDVLEGNRYYPKSLAVMNKIDTLSLEQLERVRVKFKDAVFVSAELRTNIDALKEAIFAKLDFIRIYTKDPGKQPDMKDPMIMLRGSTIKDFCIKLHRDFVEKFKYARVWGHSAKFPGQKQMLKHILQEGDIVEVHVR